MKNTKNSTSTKIKTSLHKRARSINWLALDSRLDSGVYACIEFVKYLWSGYASFFQRFHISGLRRWINEFLSETFNLGTAGALMMLVLSFPAYRIIEEGKWQGAGRYSVTFLDRYGNEIGHRGILHDDAVPFEELPSHLLKATLATEDRRFYTHFGIDIIGTLRAMMENVRASTVVQGGSSISQQLAKILFLSSERTLDRKIKEAFLALWLEHRMSKDEIFKLYLDRAYMGGGAHGVEAASQLYFGKSVREINLAEAAMLSGLFKAPTRFSPHANLPAARARANEVLDNMVEAGFMTEGQVHGARLNPALPIVRQSPYDSPEYFLDWAFEETQRLARGKGDFVLTVQTTVDLELQQLAEGAISRVLLPNRRIKRVSEAAMVSMEHNGAVRAMVGGRDYGESQFNRAVHAKRQPGSSFKPYVYLAAMQSGYKPSSVMSDSPVYCGRWSPKNYNRRYQGRMTLSHALAKSINSIPVKLANKMGRRKIVATTKKLGLQNVKANCTMPLGTGELSILEHTGAYAVFANGGKAVRPFAVLEIRNSKHQIIYSRDKTDHESQQIFQKKHIANLNKMLGQVVIAGTGRRSQLEFTTTAGKTGTSQSYRDAWFLGYSGKYVTGVWYGNDNFRPTNRVTGGNLPAMSWKEFMSNAHRSYDIPQIAGLSIHPKQEEEQKRIALLTAQKKILGTIDTEDRLMPAKTLSLLNQISTLLKTVKQGKLPGELPFKKQADIN